MTVSLYPEAIFADTPPTEFDDDVAGACDAINEACAGWGTDEGLLIDIVGSQNGEMRYMVNQAFESIHGADLRMKMKSECGSGDFGVALQLMSLAPHEAECMMLCRAMKGFGTKESAIWPIICGRSNEDMELLKKSYFEFYEEDLGVKLAGELGGDFERLIFYCLQANEEEFDEDYHTDEKAETDADAFFEAGSGQFGTDESSLFELIVKSPPEHLEKINEIYTIKNERTLLSALDSEMGGDVEKGSMYATGMKLKPFETMAAHIKSTCAGFGTDELGLTCAIIRFQPFLKEVNEVHQELFEKSIQERIESEVGGDYQRLLLKIVETACA